MNLDISEQEPLINPLDVHRNETKKSSSNLNDITEESKDQLLTNNLNRPLKYSTFANNNNSNTNSQFAELMSSSSSSSLFFRNIQINNNETNSQHLNQVHFDKVTKCSKNYLKVFLGW
jgi:hypothetical protein